MHLNEIAQTSARNPSAESKPSIERTDRLNETTGFGMAGGEVMQDTTPDSGPAPWVGPVLHDLYAPIFKHSNQQGGDGRPTATTVDGTARTPASPGCVPLEILGLLPRAADKLSKQVAEFLHGEQSAEAASRVSQQRRLGDGRAALLHAGSELFGPTSQEYSRLTYDMARLEKRYSHGEVTAGEVADTYAWTSRLLRQDKAVLTLDDRKILALNLMYHAADPSNIDQGEFTTCTVTTLQEKLLSRHPSVAAGIVASAALTGGWTAPDHKKIMIDLDSLKPLPGAARYLPADGDRSYATQILNLVLTNDIVQRRHQVYKQLHKSEGKTFLDGQDNGERLLDSKGKEVLDDGGAPTRSPGVLLQEASQALTRLTGERGFIIVNKKSQIHKDLVSVGSLAEFKDVLGRMKRNGSLPAIIAVDCDNAAFLGPDQDPSPRWHVVTIRDYDVNSGTVRVSNQWGRKALSTGKLWDGPIPLNSLYEATTDFQEKKARKSK